MTSSGGAHSDGAIFCINTAGTVFTLLHSFNGTDGQEPEGPLLLSGQMLCGTTYEGGAHGYGTIFMLNCDGNGFTNLYSFSNSGDGAYPTGGMTILGTNIYGTTSEGGSSSDGTIWALSSYPTVGVVLEGSSWIVEGKKGLGTPPGETYYTITSSYATPLAVVVGFYLGGDGTGESGSGCYAQSGTDFTVTASNDSLVEIAGNVWVVQIPAGETQVTIYAQTLDTDLGGCSEASLIFELPTLGGKTYLVNPDASQVVVTVEPDDG